MLYSQSDTIAAIATAPGRGGIGIVRVSGSAALSISQFITGKTLKPRHATFTKFFDRDKQLIDEGIVLFFPAPYSFTGEDIIEFQGHGGPVVLDYLLSETIYYGARLANPGEFSERAFLNEKLDLAQAEAIADLIDSGSRQAVRAAMSSLQGKFSEKINEALAALIHLRMYVEAAIDFPEEEIDFLSDEHVQTSLNELVEHIENVLLQAKQGRLLKEGMTVVIVGKPNAGKSSLLNQLSGMDSAIVTDIPGTTRDVLREYIQIDGMPLHMVDTAGLRQSMDTIEQEGIRRAQQEIEKADHILLMIDASTLNESSIPWHEYPEITPDKKQKLTVIKNKIDLMSKNPLLEKMPECSVIHLSAKSGHGMNLLRQHLKDLMGYSENSEGKFLARRRHLDALERVRKFLDSGKEQLQEHKAGELLAEDLRQAQNALSEITGEFTSDDLLGEIFSSFCIGK